MDYAAASDLLVEVAWDLGVGAAVSTLVILGSVFVVRWLATGSSSRRDAVAARWRGRLLDAANGDITIPPADIGWRDRAIVVDVWCGLQKIVRGEARQALNRVFAATGLAEVCRRWLSVPRPVDRRLLGAVALGYLADPDDWVRLHARLDVRNPWLATAALLGLMRIDARRAAVLALERLSARPDLPRDTVRAAFREAGADAVTTPLLDWLASAPAGELAFGLPLVDTGHGAAVQSALLPLLRRAGLPVDAVCEAIRQVHDPRALPALRALTDHPAWEVRTQAVAALGRLGDADDRERLYRRVRDANGWVRYRAAESLLALPGATDTLPGLFASIDDEAARDALRHAAAERWLPLPGPVS